MDFEHYYRRQIELWNKTRQEQLQHKRIAIIGCGGLGSSLAFALGTSGIGVIDLVDFDEVAVHNIHRQIAFVLDDEGKPKAEVTAKIIRAKSPFVSVTPYVMDFKSFSSLNTEYDLILDATDNLPVREQIDRWAKNHSTPWVYGSVEAFNGHVCLFDQATFNVFAGAEHKPVGIAPPMVMQIAAFQANLALRHLVGLPVERDKLYYFYFSKTGEWITQKFGIPIDS
jgi:adenylyltransferase/sulfurtransferase